MLYTNGSKVYQVDDDGTVRGVQVTAKDKVVTVRELESVTVKPVRKVKSLPDGAVPATLGEVIAKFNVSEGNPLLYGAKEEQL